MIADSLGPLRDELNAALLRDDRNGALTLAYTALGPRCGRPGRLAGRQPAAAAGARPCAPGGAGNLPLEPLPDGTVIEHGTAVTVNYRNWMVERGVAAAWAQTLTERFQALWPGAWVVVGANE